MEVFVDDRPYQAALNDKEPLSALVNEVRDRVCVEDRIVVHIRCDGADITGSSFEERMTQPCGTYQRVDLFTGSPKDLVDDALDQADDLLRQSEADRVKIVDALAAGRTPEAIDLLARCMHAWHQVHQGIANSVSILKLDVNGIQIGGKSAADLLETTRDRLLQVRDAIEGHDFVLLSDTLQYEFEEVINTWKGVVAALRERL